MSRLSRVIAPMLQAAGLDVRPVSRADGELHELIVTNPHQPIWGRVIIDRDGLMQWGYWGDAVTDAGAGTASPQWLSPSWQQAQAPTTSATRGPPARSHQRSAPALTSRTRHQPRGFPSSPGGWWRQATGTTGRADQRTDMTQTTSDTTDPRPWVRITEDLRAKLRSGVIAPGDTVSIGQLSGQWGTSRSPAAKALHALEADGLIRRYPGVGYYVLPRP